jgi:hypothetical protein
MHAYVPRRCSCRRSPSTVCGERERASRRVSTPQTRVSAPRWSAVCEICALRFKQKSPRSDAWGCRQTAARMRLRQAGTSAALNQRYRLAPQESVAGPRLTSSLRGLRRRPTARAGFLLHAGAPGSSASHRCCGNVPAPFLHRSSRFART